MIALAERAELAGIALQSELLCKAWDLLGPSVRPSNARALKFALMIDTESYESAALMLVPDRWYTRLAMEDRHSHSWRWDLRGGMGVDVGARAATPALALTAAALRAHAHAAGGNA